MLEKKTEFKVQTYLWAKGYIYTRASSEDVSFWGTGSSRRHYAQTQQVQYGAVHHHSHTMKT